MTRAAPASSRLDSTSGVPLSCAFRRTRSGWMSKAKTCRSPADFRPFAMLEPASPKPTKPTVISFVTIQHSYFLFQLIDVADTEFDKFRAEPVKIDSELTCFQALPRLLLFGKPFTGKPRDFGGR